MKRNFSAVLIVKMAEQYREVGKWMNSEMCPAVQAGHSVQIVAFGSNGNFRDNGIVKLAGVGFNHIGSLKRRII